MDYTFIYQYEIPHKKMGEITRHCKNILGILRQDVENDFKICFVTLCERKRLRIEFSKTWGYN